MQSSTVTSEAEITDDKNLPLDTPTTELSEKAAHHRPDLASVVREFVSSTDRGATTVYVSGPSDMITDVREEVARYNDPAKVWKGQQEARVELIHDERLE
jgi:NAD(P)H-flavin reductase